MTCLPHKVKLIGIKNSVNLSFSDSLWKSLSFCSRYLNSNVNSFSKPISIATFQQRLLVTVLKFGEPGNVEYWVLSKKSCHNWLPFVFDPSQKIETIPRLTNLTSLYFYMLHVLIIGKLRISKLCG